MTTATARNGRAARVPTIAPAELQPAPTSPRSLAEALLAFQTEAPKLLKDSEAKIVSPKGSYTYKYVTLDGVLDDVVPLLLKFDLLWTAKAAIDEHGNPAVHYCMTHVPSGDRDEWTGPLPCERPGPQALGSALTYMRRYTLVAYLNLAPGDDDDGAAASQNGVQNAERNAQPQAAPAKPSDRPATAPQRKMLRAKARDAGLSAERLANVILVATGTEAREWTDEAAAERWLGRAMDRLPARHVNAVVEGIGS